MQPKPKEQICQNAQNFLFENRYFVMCLHKCKLNVLKKKYEEKWENAYLTVKYAIASWALSGTQSPAYRLMYL